jgi:hypothetical protein
MGRNDAVRVQFVTAGLPRAQCQVGTIRGRTDALEYGAMLHRLQTWITVT